MISQRVFSRIKRKGLFWAICLKSRTARSFFIWILYGNLTSYYYSFRFGDVQPDPRAEFFKKDLFLQGYFEESLVRIFLKDTTVSPVTPFILDDSIDGYYKNTSVPVDIYNNVFIFRKLTSSALLTLNELLKSIEPVITSCIRKLWRVVQVRYWEVKPGGEGIGTNDWHTDGFPRDALKILCFFSDVDELRGITKIEDLAGNTHSFTGRAGMWILFHNSILRHCGSPPRKGYNNRLTVEITIAPAFIVDTTPVQAGVNGHYPYMPWH